MSNYFTDRNSNWREMAKRAAMTAVNDLDVEKAFADQASGFVENKVGDLMGDAHRIGFEIVKKNDDNTRMIGIYAFKVNDNLIFAPVFFINGEIKGPLLYRCDTKTFIPANKDWSSYLIESLERTEGKGRSRSRRGDAPPRVDMDRMAFRSKAMAKSAAGSVKEENTPAKEEKIKVDLKTVKEKQEISLKDAEIDKKTRSVGTQSSDSAIKAAAVEEFGEDIEHGIVSAILETMPKMASGATVDGSLAEMLREPVFGKVAAASVLAAAEGSEEFAAQLVRLYGGAGNLFPDSYTVEGDMDKSAAVAAPELTIHYSMEGMEKGASVAREFFDQGFYVLDTRPTEGLSVVDENTDASLQHASKPGFYSILMADGSYKDDVFVAETSNIRIEPTKRRDNNSKLVCCCSSNEGDVNDGTRPSDLFRRFSGNASSRQRILVKDGKALFVDGDVWGIYTGTPSELKDDGVKAKEFYYIFLKGGDVLLGPVSVHSVKEADGVKYCQVADGGGWSSHFRPNDLESCAQMIINGDLQKSEPEKLVFGSDAKFVRIDTEVEVDDKYGLPIPDKYKDDRDPFDRNKGFNAKPLFDTVMPADSLSDTIYNNFGLDEVKVTFDGEKRASYNIEANGRRSEGMNSVVMMVKLARDLNIHADTAYELMSKARDNGSVRFMLGLSKEASRLHLVDRPTFDEGFDSEFGVPTQPVKEYHLRVEGQQQFEPPSAIGDALNPTSPTGLPDSTVVSTDPSDLQALADVYKVPHVFEHGVVGTLAETFNALSMLDKYIPKIEDGVDALGRIKFLLHWCPNDFEKGYGSDDMMNLEAEVDSNFTSQGALLLKLMKRSDRLRRQDGTDEADNDK